MTGLMHEREFSRKTFLKGGGALVVGFSLAGAALASNCASRVDMPVRSGPDPDRFVDRGFIPTTPCRDHGNQAGDGTVTDPGTSAIGC